MRQYFLVAVNDGTQHQRAVAMVSVFDGPDADPHKASHGTNHGYIYRGDDAALLLRKIAGPVDNYPNLTVSVSIMYTFWSTRCNIA